MHKFFEIDGYNPADTDVFKTSSGRLKKTTTSYDQIRHHHESGKRRPIYDVLKTSDLRRLQGVQFRTSWRRLIYDVFRTSGLRCLQDVRFTSSWRRPISIILKTSHLRRLEDVWFMMSCGRLISNTLNTPDLRRLENVQFTTVKWLLLAKP